MSIRLDEMTINEVENYYKTMFNNILTEDEFEKISTKYKEKYDEVYNYHYIHHFKVNGGMGRGFKYILAILYGWYIEELIFILIKKNNSVKEISYSGNDSEHNFIFDNESKLIKIAGEKTTNPDFLITLKNGYQFFIELKTAAAGIFTIKKGNVMQLYKTVATTQIYSIILMIDIVNGLYEFKDLNYFETLHPFVNQRMEGQLCYNFPTPTKPFSNLTKENFLSEYNDKIFKNNVVFKYTILEMAKNKNNRELLKIAKNKLAIENKKEELKFQIDTYSEEIKKLINNCPSSEQLTWEELFNLLKDQ